jgi:uncharacterized membrane protein YvbJ
MICPNCGEENPETSKMCVKCGSKFEFLHAYGDPGSRRVFNLAGLKTKKQKVASLFLVSLSIVILALIIISWMRSN